MLKESLKLLFDRDLKNLKSEIESYKSEEDIWHVGKGVANSSGNLCLHIIGNLNWFIGSQFGGTGYVRHKELEFSTAKTPRVDLLIEVDKTRLVIERVLTELTIEQLEADYPIVVFKQNPSTTHFLIHLSTHLAYHLGQINYQRRLLSENDDSVI